MTHIVRVAWRGSHTPKDDCMQISERSDRRPWPRALVRHDAHDGSCARHVPLAEIDVETETCESAHLVVVTPERPVSCSPSSRKTVTERGCPALRQDDPFARSDFQLPYSRTCDNRKLLDTPGGNNNVTGFPASAGAAMMRLARGVPYLVGAESTSTYGLRGRNPQGLLPISARVNYTATPWQIYRAQCPPNLCSLYTKTTKRDRFNALREKINKANRASRTSYLSFLGIRFEKLGGLDRKEGATSGWQIKIRARGGKGLFSEIGNTGAHLSRLSPRNARLTGWETDSHKRFRDDFKLISGIAKYGVMAQLIMKTNSYEHPRMDAVRSGPGRHYNLPLHQKRKRVLVLLDEREVVTVDVKGRQRDNGV
ncbi:hypothetical protein F5888DRAFT_1638959 [Russula emetica]|nr:hypothetical protein F5888DRAFT_1638959 [Russula emetica]